MEIVVCRSRAEDREEWTRMRVALWPETAAAAARLGMGCELVLPRIVPRSGEDYEQSGNVLLDRLLGARLRVLPAGQDPGGVLERVGEELRAAGRKPYVIPVGGSTAQGALGYVQALFELLDQTRGGDVRVDAIVVPVGSAGTVGVRSTPAVAAVAPGGVPLGKIG
jgi:1-aminocyclopropane-1-carboxylate deaminase/D-cysteine desulfhydrase-like pyridoxal-dependent ACC family enzyme